VLKHKIALKEELDEINVVQLELERMLADIKEVD
jgi:hypothetical protein